jgi:hypothetical protein
MTFQESREGSGEAEREMGKTRKEIPGGEQSLLSGVPGGRPPMTHRLCLDLTLSSEGKG